MTDVLPTKCLNTVMPVSLAVMFANLVAAMACISTVTAHGGVIGYNIGGVYYPGLVPENAQNRQVSIQRQWTSRGPLTNALDGKLACNNPGTIASRQQTATVAAGSLVTAYWNVWPHDLGPVIVHMANCDGECTNADPALLDWFKIDEGGLISGTLRNGYWAAKKMIETNNSWTSTIPRSLPNGNYLIRHETIAFHLANQPQFYPECAQLRVIGGGEGNPGPTVRFPGAYDPNDPTVNINLNTSYGSTYIVPGGTIWHG